MSPYKLLIAVLLVCFQFSLVVKAQSETKASEYPNVIICRVLYTTVRMMDATYGWASLGNGCFKCGECRSALPVIHFIGSRAACIPGPATAPAA